MKLPPGKLGKTIGIPVRGIFLFIFVFLVTFMTSSFHAQEKGEILLVPGAKKQANADSNGPNKKLTPRQLIENLKKRKFSGKIISFQFERADVRDLLSVFSRISGIKMEVDPEVKELMTCSGKLIPWDKALDFFLRENRLYATLDGDIIRIRPVDIDRMDDEPSFLPGNIWFIAILIFFLSGVYFFLYRGKKKQRKPAEKAKKIILDPAKADEYLDALTALFENDKIYREEEISLQFLADKLSIPPYQLSMVINEKLNKTFFDLVNDYRMEEVKKRLEDWSENHTKILAIAFDAGFNTKTSFNRTFKKYTGMTPTQYRNGFSKTGAKTGAGN